MQLYKALCKNQIRAVVTFFWFVQKKTQGMIKADGPGLNWYITSKKISESLL